MARGRFTSAYPERMMLVDAIREITRHVDPEHPETVSAPAFNAARAEAGHPDCPTAKQCAARLNRPWSSLRRQVSDPAHSWQQDTRRAPHVALQPERVEWVVRHMHAAVAAHLGAEPGTLVLRELDWQERVEALNRRRQRRNPMGSVPTYNQVLHSAACSRAELLGRLGLPSVEPSAGLIPGPHGDTPSQEECVQSAMAFLRSPAGLKPTKDRYRAWYLRQGDRPSANSLTKSRLGFHGTLERARRRLRMGGPPEHPVLDHLHQAQSDVQRAALAILLRGSATPAALAEELHVDNSNLLPILRGLEGVGGVHEVARRGGDRTERFRYALHPGLPAELIDELATGGASIVAGVRRERTARRSPLHPKSEAVLAAVRRLDAGDGVRSQQLVAAVDLPPQHVRNHIRILKDRGVLARSKVTIVGERWREVSVYSLTADAELLLGQHQ